MILNAITFAVFGFLMENILTGPGEIFAGLRRWIVINTRNGERNAVCYWLYRVTIDCAKCIAGNAALWWYLLEFKPLTGVRCAVFAIFFAYILNALNKVYEQY